MITIFAKHNSNRKTHVKNNRAFTIIETLVAISILTIALTGPLAIVSQSLRSSYFARDQITAHYLAQEAVEYLRNKRDQNGLQKTSASDWLSGIRFSDTSDGSIDLLNQFNALDPVKAYLIRTSNGYVLKKCAQDGDEVCPPLRYDPSGERIYGMDGSQYTESIFTREIILTKSPQDPDAKREVNVSVIVKWHTSSITSQATIDERLYNWQLEEAPVTP